ncbi:hypothetical protein GQ602_001487 [Ophiocordyceps camponoti-floridani]|uniref:Hydrophobin n=1 Tax=Ophiocordyceps camponoti-floridani TaxID=2030778 RepID=A0A8H4VH98_9HYPO|nr:hypothetical protein GQ602_001487 [Ophiocordyceps camponoti-floridani]
MYALQLITLAAAALAIPMPGNEGYGNDKAMKSYGSDNGYGSGSGSSDSGYGSGGDEHNDYARDGRDYGRGDGTGVWRADPRAGNTFAQQCGNDANAHCCENRGRGQACKKIIALDLLVQDHCRSEVCCSGPQHGLVNVGCISNVHSITGQ